MLVSLTKVKIQGMIFRKVNSLRYRISIKESENLAKNEGDKEIERERKKKQPMTTMAKMKTKMKNLKASHMRFKRMAALFLSSHY